MQPHIDKSTFGSLVIEGQIFKYDVVIDLAGTIRKRNKKLSKAEYGSSHTLSLAEAMDVTYVGMTALLIGSGMFDNVRLSDEAARYFERQNVPVTLLPTPEAIQYWNDSDIALVGLFHITC